MSIKLEDASLSYPDGTAAVRGVNLEITPGERVAIVGQNGAGKTSTVKMMNGLLSPTGGAVTVDGADTRAQSAATTARSVAYVFQNPDDQLFEANVRAELEYMPRYLKWEEATKLERVREAVELTGIGNILDLNPNDLPFAIKKFVAIAAALLMRPRYLILDEPTAGLDARGILLLNRVIDAMTERGTAVITITHDMRYVADTFERVVVMAHGQVIKEGTPQEIFNDDAALAEAHLERPLAAQVVRDAGFVTDKLRLSELADIIPSAPANLADQQTTR